MMKLRYILLPILILSITSALGQVREFNTDPEKFWGDVEQHLKSYDKRDAKDFVEKFTPLWESGQISDQRKQRIIRTSQAMLEKRLRPYPDFKAYWFTALNYFQEGKAENFDTWQSTVDKAMESRNKRRTSEYIVTCGNMVMNNTVYESRSVKWQFYGGSYEFAYEGNEPEISFKDIKLVLRANEDSSVIHNTSGVYYPYTNRWYGEDGKIDWQRVELPPEETFAEIGSYEVNMKTSSYKCDSVMFTTPYFETPLVGKLTEKVLKQTRSGIVSYPRFESYDQRLRISNIVEGVDYDGGFTMAGAEFVGAGTPEELAQLIFKREGEPFIYAGALNFVISSDQMSSSNTQIVVRIDEDSLTHPSVRMEYLIDKGVLQLSREKEGLGQSAFFNTYHNLSMNVEQMTWNRKDTVLVFKWPTQSTKKDASFESIDFFSRALYDQLQGMEQMHPLVGLSRYAIKYDRFDFPAADAANAMHRTLTQLKPLFIQLSNLGFIYYDINKEYIYTKPKLFDYVKARAGKADYDDIYFESNPEGEAYNAILDIRSHDLEIVGIERVTLSNAHIARIYPGQARKITVHKDRDMTFSGIVNIGNTEYFGNLFTFQYDEFKVNLMECDSMRVRVWPPGQRKWERVSSVIEDVEGYVTIDDSTNRSATDTSLHEYPILTMTKETYVYYDKIYKGVYPRESFKFIIAPFEMDSLDKYPMRSVHFDGIFKSAGIFPDITESLRVMDDYSLGFIRKAPEEGFDMYTDAGLFENTMKLSGKGLQGDGTINFLTATAISEAFTFFPDSTAGIAHTFENRESEDPVDVPKVKGEDTYVTFVPDNDVIKAKSMEKDIQFFGEQARMDGTIFLRPEGMTGRGKMSFGTATLAARRFTYSTHNIFSDTAEFYLKNYDTEQNALAFKTDNVSANVDFEKRQGLFKSNSENSFVEFPEIQYICYMDEFKWFMDNDDIELQKKTDLTIESTEFEKPNFYSTHPDQDSLSFMAPFARFSRGTKEIRCSDVPFIDVADARIVPDSGIVVVKKKAKIETLKDAQIIANNITQNHLIINAKVDITAKREYQAEGDYYYVDENDESYKIHFEEIAPDETYETYAQGEIPKEDSFRLSPNFEYYGEVELFASNKALLFTGATRIAHECDIPRNWMKFSAVIEPKDIRIPVIDSMVNIEGDPLGAGLVMNPDSIHVYSTFLSRKGAENHINVMSATGVLIYDKGAKEYRISNEEKLLDRSQQGNFVSLHTESCLLAGDGNINLGGYLDQVKTRPVGTISLNTTNDNISSRIAMSVNFPFNDNALERMVDKINEKEGLLPVEIGKTYYEKSIREITEQEDADEIMADIALQKKVKLGSELATSIYFADIKFNWDNNVQAFVSEGLIGIAHVGKETSFRYVNGKVALLKRRRDSRGHSNDRLIMYLELSPDEWYFFQYSGGKEGIMEAVSSDDEFNKILLETKEDKTKYKGDKETADYKYMASPSKKKKDAFLRLVE